MKNRRRETQKDEKLNNEQVISFSDLLVATKVRDNAEAKEKPKRKLSIGGTIRAAIIIASMGSFGLEGGYALKTRLNEYKSLETIKFDADLIGADMLVANYLGRNGLLRSDFRRLIHNDDKPIYVNILNEVPEDVRYQIIDALERTEYLFSNINPKYNFEIVETPEYVIKRLTGDSGISFGLTEQVGIEGVNRSKINLFAHGFLNGSRIKLNIKNDALASSLPYVITHELMHSFGLGDVYKEDTGGVINNATFMSINETNKKLTSIYPNDLAILHALYNSNLSKDGVANSFEVARAKSHITEYSRQFTQGIRNVWNEKVFEPIETKFSSVQEKQLEKPLSFEVTYNSSNYGEKQCKSIITLGANNRATFETYINNMTKRVLETTTTYTKLDDFILLHNVRHECGLYPSDSFKNDSIMYGILSIDGELKVFNNYDFVKFNLNEHTQLIQNTQEKSCDF